MKLKIAIGADHRGFKLKEFLMCVIKTEKYQIEWIDCGAYDEVRSDYPIFAKSVTKKIIANDANLGVLICSTGAGICIAANRVPGIYAAVAWTSTIGKLIKEDDNANVLVLPSSFVSNEEARKILESWLDAEFKGGRYQQRLDMI